MQFLCWGRQICSNTEQHYAQRLDARSIAWTVLCQIAHPAFCYESSLPEKLSFKYSGTCGVPTGQSHSAEHVPGFRSTGQLPFTAHKTQLRRHFVLAAYTTWGNFALVFRSISKPPSIDGRRLSQSTSSATFCVSSCCHHARLLPCLVWVGGQQNCASTTGS